MISNSKAGSCESPSEDPAELRVVILDVGHGNSAIVYDGEAHLVVDVAQELTLIKELDLSKAREISHLVLSHADADHIRGAAALLAHADLQVGSLWVNPDPTKISQLFIDLMYIAQDQFLAGRLNVSTNLNIGANPALCSNRIGVEIVHPGIVYAISGQSRARRPQGQISSNGMSAVLRVSLDGAPAVLLPGDLDDRGLRTILETASDISAPVLVFPHHGGGSGGSSNRDFARQLCEAVRPRLVIFSHGRNMFSNPRADIVAGIRDASTDVDIACTQLSRNCHASTESLIVDHLTERPAMGRSSNACCAGSIVIRLVDGVVSWTPSREKHAQFVDLVESPMCRLAPVTTT
ncbi:MBL fold metallo-hydrolase [[Actinomadura] parvosata]|uniref:MBL fold metallo-hydrolase n=1 Tax=[Actinomadura] parvosata TaxID=1955412 RepID=UPI001647B36A